MKQIIVTIAGDSGDGIQLLGSIFTNNLASQNYQFKTLPDFPAEIRAPAGTTHGVSGFQIQYGFETINTAGHFSDIFIAFNAAALKKYSSSIHPNGIILYDPLGFDLKNYKLATYSQEEFDKLSNRKIAVEFSKMTKESLKNFDISEKEKDHNKNIFALGFLDFVIHTNSDLTKNLLEEKFKKSMLKDSMIEALSKGFHYAETIEFSFEKMEKSNSTILLKANRKNITGNSAIALAIIAAPFIFDRNVFFSGYPITPASDILHELAKYNFKELTVKQAEDEIAAASMALGASFGGSIGITASSGPGIDLKQEVIGLAQMAEIPLLIIDVQRAGPSTGMPTKIEQSDLNLVLYGRHGDSSIPVVAIRSSADAYSTALNAIEITIKYQTPVFLLSDALIANGSELWEIPDLKKRNIDLNNSLEPFSRNENLVRPWINLGDENINYIAGGLEKDFNTGNISYEGKNHEKMVNVRTSKIQKISQDIPACILEENSSTSGTLVISWGSTYGVVREAIESIENCAHLHLEWINPLPENFIELTTNFQKIIVVELNHGQLADYLGAKISQPIIKINKIQGSPFFSDELKEKIRVNL